ncbi:MAG: DUF711 family protein [Chloroflexi bacterium]|nr:DUF711 family protein [Chloroflexota bacterium]
MKIRAVTLGLDLPMPEVSQQPFTEAGQFLADARRAFENGNVEVQTLRLAGGELDALGSNVIQLRNGVSRWAARTEGAARDSGIEYLSLGRLPSTAHAFVGEHMAPILAAGEIVFFSADLIDGRLPSVAMARACATAAKQLAATTPLGFGNLRFAATAHCPANIPFLPAAYHMGGPPRFSVAVEAADVVVAAFDDAGGMSAIEDRLVGGLEAACEPVERIADQLAAASGFGFVGIDLSPAPFPANDRSIGAAIELAGVAEFGAPGTLYVAAMITRAIRRTRLRRCGFSGLMLPVLEDSVLASRAAQRSPSVHELLLYSAVCGTGLDTIPLPGAISEAELAGVYLDVAAMSVALDGKPLTVRLMPVPGGSAGDPTAYDFEYFANSRILRMADAGAARILERGQ